MPRGDHRDGCAVGRGGRGRDRRAPQRWRRHTRALSLATGLIKNANSVCLNGRPLQTDLQHRLDHPVRLANDANCLALSEAVDGAARDAHTVFSVILGTGIGGGIVIDKQMMVGANAIAGEWGHNPLP